MFLRYQNEHIKFKILNKPCKSLKLQWAGTDTAWEQANHHLLRGK